MRTTTSRAALAALAAVLLTATAAACGDDDDDDAASDTTAAGAAPATTAGGGDAATTAPAATDAPGTTTGGSEAPAGDGATVAAGESDLGTILVDGEGMTLYLFVPDDQGPSTCEGDCLAAWPALEGPVTAGEGADDSMLGTATRPDDGSEQATYNGWPLYYFAQDAAAGDTTGQGLGDNWYVIDAATGEAISG